MASVTGHIFCRRKKTWYETGILSKNNSPIIGYAANFEVRIIADQNFLIQINVTKVQVIVMVIVLVPVLFLFLLPVFAPRVSPCKLP